MQNRARRYIIRVWRRLNVIIRIIRTKPRRDDVRVRCRVSFCSYRFLANPPFLTPRHRRILQGHEAAGTRTLRSTDIALYNAHIYIYNILHLKWRLNQTLVKKKKKNYDKPCCPISFYCVLFASKIGQNCKMYVRYDLMIFNFYSQN